MCQPGVKVFSITLNGLDYIIKDRRQEQEPKLDKTEESLRQKVPSSLHVYLDFFLKKESNTLALHRAINYKIKLTKENTLGFCHLNKHLLKELEAM